MSQTRRLAAILAADVAGYSRLMGRTRRARSNASRRCAASFPMGSLDEVFELQEQVASSVAGVI
jgi:hypothetical protein